MHTSDLTCMCKKMHIKERNKRYKTKIYDANAPCCPALTNKKYMCSDAAEHSSKMKHVVRIQCERQLCIIHATIQHHKLKGFISLPIHYKLLSNVLH